MTIDEAIRHCEYVAGGFTEQGKCAECAAEHRQLAEWLKELKDYRERMPSYDAGYNQGFEDGRKSEQTDYTERDMILYFDGYISHPEENAIYLYRNKNTGE